MTPLRWNLPTGVAVAMSLAEHGDLRDPDRRAAWCATHDVPPPAVVKQVHGARVVAAEEAVAPIEADALISSGAAIGVFGADCPPVIIAAASMLGVAHGGWRGCAAGIVANLVTALKGRDASPPTGWHALVGPGVHPDDYEVDAPVLSARAWPAGALAAGRPGRAWLDLPAALAADAAASGIGSVGRSALTTSRDPRLRSHRRDGPGFPQLLVAWRQICAG
jgi:copper oxidase (laccase) domain-containing protein